MTFASDELFQINYLTSLYRIIDITISTISKYLHIVLLLLLLTKVLECSNNVKTHQMPAMFFSIYALFVICPILLKICKVRKALTTFKCIHFN